MADRAATERRRAPDAPPPGPLERILRVADRVLAVVFFLGGALMVAIAARFAWLVHRQGDTPGAETWEVVVVAAAFFLIGHLFLVASRAVATMHPYRWLYQLAPLATFLFFSVAFLLIVGGG